MGRIHLTREELKELVNDYSEFQYGNINHDMSIWADRRKDKVYWISLRDGYAKSPNLISVDQRGESDPLLEFIAEEESIDNFAKGYLEKINENEFEFVYCTEKEAFWISVWTAALMIFLVAMFCVFMYLIVWLQMYLAA